jgi:hypothetical protein
MWTEHSLPQSDKRCSQPAAAPGAPSRPHIPPLCSRRDFLFRAGLGFGSLALAWLWEQEQARGQPALGPRVHHLPRAQAVIFLFMEGGPSHLDTFDPKPALRRWHGHPLPASFGPVLTPMGVGGSALMASARTFRRYGASGIEVADWLPHLARCVDDLAVIRSMWADGLNHVGSVCQMNTGSILAGRPSLGAWVLYGLGSANQDLPGFVVLTDTPAEPAGGARNWGTGFMPAIYQGTYFRPGPSPILHLAPPQAHAAARQRRQLDLLRALNEHYQQQAAEEEELAARTAAYELAFRMQVTAPQVVDLSREPRWLRQEYGLDRPECADYAHRCLLARRLVERGVRFVQIYCGSGSQWDAHSNLESNHRRLCARCDQPTAALLRDLKRRGLLDTTLVIWGGEFGRTPMSEGGTGRDHNPYGFTLWLAGGGIRGGQVYGATDEFGLRAVENPVHVHDLHATILYLLGLDHRRLTFRHNGREERLTENSGRVLTALLR